VTVYWLTGLPGSGKTTIAKAMARLRHVEVLDGDDLRRLWPELGFSREDRIEQARRTAHLARRLSAYVDVVVATISPFRACREIAREIVGPGMETIWVYTDAQTCEERDPKGLWARARAGEIAEFTGVSSAFESPVFEPHLMVETDGRTPLDCAETILYVERAQVFIGRWQPLHTAHVEMMRAAMARGPVAAGIRNTPISADNPYTFEERREMFARALPEVTVFLIPDLTSVHYGRAPGWSIIEEPPIEGASASDIRASRAPAPEWV
jgi:adenylyl-sulfate kinase